MVPQQHQRMRLKDDGWDLQEEWNENGEGEEGGFKFDSRAMMD